MADTVRIFTFHGAAGPLDGLSPTVTGLLRDGTVIGSGIPLNAIGEGGGYSISVGASFVTQGVILVADAGTNDAIDRYQVQVAAVDGLIAALFLDLDGTPKTSGVVEWSAYLTPSGSDYISSAPAWEYLFPGTWVTTVPEDHLELNMYGVCTPSTTSPTPTQAWVLTLEDSGSAPPSPTPPTIAVSPPVGGIGSTSPITVTVTDPDGLRRTIIVATYATGNAEVVTDGVDFFAPFLSSTSSPTTNGRVYTVRRTGGWRDSPTLRVYAVDTTGSEG